MSLLAELTANASKLKMGGYGPEGSGKTLTSVLIAIGLIKHLGLKKPPVFFDTEGGFDFVEEIFHRAGIKNILGIKSQAFSDLRLALQEAEEVGSIMITDSVTSAWREATGSYKISVGYRCNNCQGRGNRDNKKCPKCKGVGKMARKQLTVADWGPIKDMWREGWADPFKTTDLHIIELGRRTNIFMDMQEEDGENADKKKWNAKQVGTRMATEKESGYEPNLLVEFERNLATTRGVSGAFVHTATVLKDRQRVLTGKSCDFWMPVDNNGNIDEDKLIKENRPFRFFWPHIEKLKLGTVHSSTDTTRTSVAMMDDGSNEEIFQRRQRRKDGIAHVEEMLQKHFPGTGVIEKKNRADITEALFAERSWDVITGKFSLEKIIEGYKSLRLLLDPNKVPREALEAALSAGVDGKKVVDGDAACDELKTILIALAIPPEEKKPVPEMTDAEKEAIAAAEAEVEAEPASTGGDLPF
jgi:hypothetical protein